MVGVKPLIPNSILQYWTSNSWNESCGQKVEKRTLDSDG